MKHCSLPTTSAGDLVYNFAIARVRAEGGGAPATDVRVFFRIFTSQTTAALTYLDPLGGDPQQGYKRTLGANPIALPGTNAAGDAWLSFPFFSEDRHADPEMQPDQDNMQDVAAGPDNEFFGALIDNNLTDPYLPLTPGGAPNVPLSTSQPDTIALPAESKSTLLTRMSCVSGKNASAALRSLLTSSICQLVLPVTPSTFVI